MANLAETKINKVNSTLDDIKKTRPEPHQEFCAYTYLLLPQPMNNVYGILKIIATGPTYNDVQNTVKNMFNDGRLDDSVPFVTICPTGVYKYLHPGGDPHNAKDVYNTELKEVVLQEREKSTEKKKKQMEEVEERARRLQEDARRQEEKNPESFDVYSNYRVKEVSIKGWIRAQEAEIKIQKKKLLEATKKRQQLDKTQPSYRFKFEKELQGVVQQEKEVADIVVEDPDATAVQTPTESVEGKGKDEF